MRGKKYFFMLVLLGWFMSPGLVLAEQALDVADAMDEAPLVTVADPLEPWNRAMFDFNDKLYFWVLKPVAQGYEVVVPKPVRRGVRNFFTNLTTPIRLVNCLLQGKVEDAANELGRFMVNSSLGLLGLMDVVYEEENLPAKEEDFGQTLGSYGLDHGIFIVWPFLGPSSLRDTVGLAGDLALDPVTYVEPLPASMGVRSGEKINDTSLTIGDYEALKDAAIEPYEAMRNAYIQYRAAQVRE